MRHGMTDTQIYQVIQIHKRTQELPSANDRPTELFVLGKDNLFVLCS